MKKFNLKDFTRGWLVGAFNNALYNKDYELGFKYYNVGDYGASHYHLTSDEITIVLFGEVEMNGIRYQEGDIVVQGKGEATDFRCISERAITAVYRPDNSCPTDKYFVKEK